jgi:hypothetical protein
LGDIQETNRRTAGGPQIWYPEPEDKSHFTK